MSILPQPLPGNTGSKNPSERLGLIRAAIADGEQRVRDLEALLTSILLQQPLNFIVSMPIPNQTKNTDDANMVRQELYAAQAYVGNLRTDEQFWNSVTEQQKQAEKDTQKHSNRA